MRSQLYLWGAHCRVPSATIFTKYSALQLSADGGAETGWNEPKGLVQRFWQNSVGDKDSDSRGHSGQVDKAKMASLLDPLWRGNDANAADKRGGESLGRFWRGRRQFLAPVVGG